MNELVFLKLGGSLITDKTVPYTPRLQKLQTLAKEIQLALTESPNIQLILGHGSGSFGHQAVQEHLSSGSRHSVQDRGLREDEAYWQGFSEVWYRASELNRHVMNAVRGSGLRAISLPPSAAVTASDGRVTTWALAPLRAAIEAGLLPVIFGDIVFDRVTGGSVLSTETLMIYLAKELGPRRILLAGLEPAVWADFPHRKVRIDRISPSTYGAVSDRVGGSHGADVTGGMKSKVEDMLALVRELPSLEIQIFSGEEPGNVQAALKGALVGTLITSD